MKFTAISLFLLSAITATPITPEQEIEMEPFLTTTMAQQQPISTPLTLEFANDDFAPDFPLPEGAVNATFVCDTEQGQVPGSMVPGASEAMQDALSFRPNARRRHSAPTTSNQPGNYGGSRGQVARPVVSNLDEWSRCTLQYAELGAMLGFIYIMTKVLDNSPK